MHWRGTIGRLTFVLAVASPGAATQALTDPLPDLAVGPDVFRLEAIVSGLVFPTDVAVPPDGSPRLFVNQIDGVVRVIEDGVLLPMPFVDLSADYQPSNGSAMSSIVFHPDFAGNRKLYVIMSELEDPALADFGHALAGVAGAPRLAGTGALASGSKATLVLSDAAPASVATLVIGTTELGVSFKGGVMVPALDVLLPGLPIGPGGDLVLSASWPRGMPPGVTFFFQHWIADAAGPQGLAASNAIRGTTP
jgi:hypothetical protein